MKRKHKPGWSRADLTAFAAEPGKVFGRQHVDEAAPSWTAVAARVAALAIDMHDIADELEHYGGLDAHAVDRAAELHGAAETVKGWADEIRKTKVTS